MGSEGGTWEELGLGGSRKGKYNQNTLYASQRINKIYSKTLIFLKGLNIVFGSFSCLHVLGLIELVHDRIFYHSSIL